MEIGVIADPENTVYWPQIEAFLTPAAKRGNLAELIGEHELCWGVLDDGELVAALTGRWLPDERQIEVILVGGRDHRRWLRALDAEIANWARLEGATCVRAYGRKGWGKVLGWKLIGEADGFYAYERGLN
jgi:hypothetical protein